MTAISNYLEDKWLRMLALKAAFTAPDTYVSLHTADPTDAAGGAEVSGGSYARVQMKQDSATSPYWTNPADDSGPQEIHNSGALTFPTATASWGTVTHFGVWDAVSGGNLLYKGALTVAKTVTNGDTVSYATGNLKLKLD
jgi:hypothetical protein